MNRITRLVVTVIAVLALMFSISACGVTTPPDVTKLQIGAGPFEDPEFKGCIAPGIKDNSPTNDEYIPYPVSGRDYDAGTTESADTGAMTVVSKDNAQLSIPVRVTWDFNTDCEALGEFYKLYNRYGAQLNDDGSNTEGWSVVLDKVFGNTLDTTLDEIAKDYKWRDLYNNAEAQNALQTALDENLQDAINVAAKGEFFTNVNVATIKKPTPTDENLIKAIAAEQSAVASAQSAEAQAKAEEAQAIAEVKVARAAAEKQQATIDGFGGYENYSRSQAIENGLNPFQPTYIVGGTQPQN